jgi:hypothetical protein
VLVPPQTSVLPTSPIERLVRIIDGVCAAIAARGAGGALTTPLLFLLWSRLRRIAIRATRAAARIAAGARAAARERTPAPRPPRPQPLRLPRGYAWVVRLVPGTAAYGTQLQALLADPLMAPLAADPSMRRLLNPLRQMLGVPKPPPRPTPRPAAVPPRPITMDQGGDEKPAGRAPPPPTSPVAA